LFLIVGGGKDELKLKALARDCENIVFVGRVPHSDIPKFYKSVDLFVLPSLYEGVPLVIVEASASGLPVVCTDVRDAKDVIIDEVSGFIVPKDNADVMALRILDVLNDDKLAKSMGLAGQKLMLDKFDMERNINECVELWKSVVK
jgi:glycosyltransferase involved in cell wall biosynthesis